MTVTDFKTPGRHPAQTLVQVGRLGHAWSGGARDERFSDGNGPDASRMAWVFAAKHFSRSGLRRAFAVETAGVMRPFGP